MRKKMLNMAGDRVRGVFRQALSPTFLFILLGSALLWYASKLSNSYDTEIPLNIRIDGQKYRLTATVSGRGSTILAQRLSLKSRLSFALDELVSRPSRETPGALTITPVSLQRAINGKITDLVIVEVNKAPEFVPPAVEDDDPDTGTPNKNQQRHRKAKKAAKVENSAGEAKKPGTK